MNRPRGTLATLAADPDRVESVPAHAIPELIGEAEALRARLWARLQAQSASTSTSQAPARTQTADKLLTAEEAAARLGVNKRWVYRRADKLPFTKRLGPGTLRFSERGLERWKESRV